MSKINLEMRLAMCKRPNEKAIMQQSWRDLLFLHWEYCAEELQKTLPPGLYVDTFEEKAYVGVIPFFLKNLRFTGLPALPGLSNFVEVNLRTYVHDKNGIPGVWFYSLDLNSKLGTYVARQFFSLPYHHAEFKTSKTENQIAIKGRRLDQFENKMEFEYQPEKEIGFAVPSTIDFFLLERYALFSFSANQLSMECVHHTPYPLKKVNVSKCVQNLFEINNLNAQNLKPNHIVYSSGVDVEIFKLKAVPLKGKS